MIWRFWWLLLIVACLLAGGAYVLTMKGSGAVVGGAGSVLLALGLLRARLRRRRLAKSCGDVLDFACVKRDRALLHPGAKAAAVYEDAAAILRKAFGEV